MKYAEVKVAAGGATAISCHTPRLDLDVLCRGAGIPASFIQLSASQISSHTQPHTPTRTHPHTHTPPPHCILTPEPFSCSDLDKQRRSSSPDAESGSMTDSSISQSAALLARELRHTAVCAAGSRWTLKLLIPRALL